MTARSHGNVPGSLVLDVEGLTVDLWDDEVRHTVVSDISFDVRAGETVGIIGESGSGKSMTAYSLVGLGPPNSRVVAGRAVLDGVDLLALSEHRLSRVRGRDIGMIFQEPRSSLNPAFTVGEQVAEVLRRHQGLGRRRAWTRAVELLDMVAIPSAARRAHDHPHRFSGGMCQRVMLAMALACEPKLLIADEPTTALDVTVQAQMLDLIKSLQNELGLAMLFITHDLGVVAEICDSMVVLYAGQVVERGTTDSVFATPRHPYTASLLACIPDVRQHQDRLGSIPGTVPPLDARPHGCRFHPRCEHAIDKCVAGDPPLLRLDGRSSRCVRPELQLVGVRESVEEADVEPRTPGRHGDATSISEPVLDVRGLARGFVLDRDLLGRNRHVVQAVAGVDLSIGAGRTLALVGESGVGKSTVGRLVLRLIEAEAGEIKLLGQDVRAASGDKLFALRRQASMVFQNPYNSFDPHLVIADAVAEPLRIHRIGHGRREWHRKALELLDAVGLTRRHGDRYPYELSGGELQRAAIARALITDPAFVVCDEPVAALDMSIRAEVVNVLRDLQVERGVSYLFITHDLGLVQIIAHDVAVMLGGEIVEHASAEEIFSRPRHDYTRQLLDAVPVPDPARRRRRSASPAAPAVTYRAATPR